MNSLESTEKAHLQENQYEFPYHHLTHERNGGLFVFRHLFWGLMHYTYISHVIEQVQKIDFKNMADVGCGEGRIISELEKKSVSGDFLGVDISKRAIMFAEAFNHRGKFFVHDITESPLFEPVDLVVSCEVIEHIEPEKVSDYVRNISQSLTVGGKILITTPTTNVPVNKKHFQHFTSEMFDSLLKENFTDITYSYLNKTNFTTRLLDRLLANRFYISNNETLNRFVLKTYNRKFLHASKHDGSRILVTATKR